jgi:molybdate transport system substrate-binding protein
MRARRSGALSVCACGLAGIAVALVLGRAALAEELRVAAASSLREPLERIAARFDSQRRDVRVQLAFGASSVLASQVRAGAPVDVLVSADSRIAERLEREGLAAVRSTVTHNRLVVMAREGGPRIEAPRDVAGPEVRRIAIPEHAVPVGRYARQWLARHGIAEAVAERAVRTEHARATLTAVDQGLVDLAIVYVTDARLARRAHVALEIPDAEQPRIDYVALVLADARDPALARTFLEFLRGAYAEKVLADAGFPAAGSISQGGTP